MSIDLHVHSTASDGDYPPQEVVARARDRGVRVFALTDHDTLAGVADAASAAAGAGVQVIAGCEFSVAVPWGEMHLLGYFLPSGAGPLHEFLITQRNMRAERGREIVRRLNRLGVVLTYEDVLEAASGGAIGRPHVARALVARGTVQSIGEAFDRFLGWGRSGFVPKELPAVEDVTMLVRAVGGVSVAAHLKDRGTRAGVRALTEAGVDGLEVLHPAQDDATRTRLARLADAFGLLKTGGSDWHGEPGDDSGRAPLGALDVPQSWLAALEDCHRGRLSR